MKKYTNFYYKNYEWKLEDGNLKVFFNFSAENEYSFAPSLVFIGVDSDRIKKIIGPIDNLVFNIGLIELFSYWKAFVSPRIIVECGFLDDFQKKWWRDLLINGMGQFFYENRIDFTEKDFVEFVSTGKAKDAKAQVSGKSILVPVGGGKDSNVTLEILSRNLTEVNAFLLNPTEASKQVVEVAGAGSVVVERDLDKKLLELNDKGFPNGHTPFTALVSFISILAAVLKDHSAVVFSNERSADEENLEYLGRKINHQYSKTLEFENKFREYNEKYLSNVNYFSFLRPLYDIQIAKMFSKFEKYFQVIKSCNVGQKTNSWCGKCPKCLSTFILFYPFLRGKTIEIFGRNLLKDGSLKPLLNSLIFDKEVKPFECVGTREELKAALGIIDDKKILNSWNEENNLPGDYQEILKEYL